MPRGVKGSVNYDEQIQRLDNKIASYQEKIEGLKEQKQGLLIQKQAVDLQEITKYMEETGITPDEVLAKLKAETAE